MKFKSYVVMFSGHTATPLLFRKWFFSKQQIYRFLDMSRGKNVFKANLARTLARTLKNQAKLFGFVVFRCSNKINLQKLSL